MTIKPIRSVRLDPMTADEYPAWEAHAASGYAQSQVQAGHWAAETALEQAWQDTRRLLPLGLATPDQHVWVARDAESGAAVGTLWIAIRRQGGRTEAYIYDVEVDPEHQGGGYGRAIMEAGAAAARGLGAEVVALNVFGFNDRAYNLYKSLGYVVANRHMRLELQPQRPDRASTTVAAAVPAVEVRSTVGPIL
ncbi:GNAT family N-acetyltransferase [Catenulispora subtropica]|uniref:N-acetyltransferase domain-containing protein n=1 Tax=Catenulispora subtropica TaxID=450798 RepID=A0ABN2R562_9ACTN